MMAPILQQHAGWLADDLLRDIVAGTEQLPGLPVTGLSLDSRNTRLGDLFFACAGYQRHGLAFVRQAVTAGAVLVLAEPTADWPAQRIQGLAKELALPVISVPDLSAKISVIAARYYAEPALGMRMTGITGTNGKTSVSQYIAQALPASWHCAVVGTTGNGFPGKLLPATHTTPDAISAQALLADLQQAGARSVAMEVSSHALHQHRVGSVPFHTAVFTNLSRDHLDYHGSMDAYAEAKASLFRQSSLQLAVINTDDELGQQLAAELRGDTRLIACGRAKDTSIKSDEYIQLIESRMAAQGLDISLDSSWGKGEVHSQLIGGFNADNLLLVLGLLLGWNVPLDEAIERLEHVQPVAGRMQCFGGNEQPLVVVDYAHTPDALEKVLQAAREHVAGKLICVFGCGGDRDQGKRPLMGALAEQLADETIVTDDNPRHEPSENIIGQIIAGMGDPQAIHVIPNRSLAIKTAVQNAAAGDVVLVAGKGHEDYQQIGDLKHPFNDAHEVEEVLQELKNG
jgi:UDP-N-acetylmuramoyl-L-alanyl-D-glutamate--2,6-diaminopimelate ligase